MRQPQRRHIGDGVYAGHDGQQFILEVSDGYQVTSRIALDDETLDGFQKYQEYTRNFYQTGQHQAGPGCEDCGKDLSDPASPIPGAIRGEVYRIELDDVRHEIRLCRECAKTVDEEFLVGIIRKRTGREG